MNPTPQAVTERYVSNLLTNGRNREFDICVINRDISTHEDAVVGVFYKVLLKPTVGEKVVGAGATPHQALRRALEKHGVTFR